MFLNQHAALHSDLLAGTAHKSFDEKVWQGLTPTDARIIPQTSAHSIAWIYWHLARIEDVTMNVLAAGGTQLFHQDDWLECLKVATQDTGNAMDSAEIASLLLMPPTRHKFIHLNEARQIKETIYRTRR